MSGESCFREELGEDADRPQGETQTSVTWNRGPEKG